MQFISRTILFATALCALPLVAGAQVSDVRKPVLLEAPKPLGDIRSVTRDPDAETYIPVSGRKHPDYSAPSMNWAGFSIKPEIVSEQKIDSNIFASGTNEEADTITTVVPSVRIDRNFSRHSMGMFLRGEGQKFWANQENDVFNADASLRGVLEARRILKIPFEVNYTSGHETRAQNFSREISKEPIGFQSVGAALGLLYRPNRLALSVTGRYGDIEFENGETETGLRIVREDDDRTFTGVEVRGSYDIAPNHQPFFSFNFGKLEYANANFDGTGFNGPKRDSDNVSALAGWRFNYKGVVYADVGLGYSERDYKDEDIQDVSTLNAAVNASWNVTKKSTVTFGLTRTINDNNDSVQGVVLTQAKLGYDKEVLHNLFYNAFINYAFLDVSNSSREDDLFSIGFGARYDITPRFSLSADYDYTNRSSTESNLDYDRHQLTARLTTKF